MFTHLGANLVKEGHPQMATRQKLYIYIYICIYIYIYIGLTLDIYIYEFLFVHQPAGEYHTYKYAYKCKYKLLAEHLGVLFVRLTRRRGAREATLFTSGCISMQRYWSSLRYSFLRTLFLLAADYVVIQHTPPRSTV